jgi:predicted component of type VI protein secretion system
VCGEVKGLLTARQNITDLKQKMENSDEWNPYWLKPQ